VCQGVAGGARAVLKEGAVSVSGGSSRKDGVFYANALTKLFEHIAQIVESHGGLVERHYGAGKMVKVIERLQREADVQGGIILDSWSDERSVDRKLTDVKSYPFSFLVQSFLPPQRSLTGTPRVHSPALGSGQNAGGGRDDSEDEGVNMKEVDGLLGEISVMLGRWALYARFLAGKCMVRVVPPSQSALFALSPWEPRCGALTRTHGHDLTGRTQELPVASPWSCRQCFCTATCATRPRPSSSPPTTS
jgi:hypothetical protein